MSTFERTRLARPREWETRGYLRKSAVGGKGAGGLQFEFNPYMVGFSSRSDTPEVLRFFCDEPGDRTSGSDP